MRKGRRDHTKFSASMFNFSGRQMVWAVADRKRFEAARLPQPAENFEPSSKRDSALYKYS